MAKKSNTEEFSKKAIAIHNNRYNYSKVDYINNSTRIIIACAFHGEFLQRPDDHLCGKGCPKCKFDKLIKLQTSNIDEFIQKARNIHGNKYDYCKSKYITARMKIVIKCAVHGEFLQTPDDHLNGKGCVKCRNDKFAPCQAVGRDRL